MKKDKKSFLQLAAKKFEEWDVKVKELEVKAKKASVKVKGKVKVELEKLKAGRSEMKAQLKEFKDRGEDAVTVVAKDISALSGETLKSLEKTWKKAKAALKG